MSFGFDSIVVQISSIIGVLPTRRRHGVRLTDFPNGPSVLLL